MTAHIHAESMALYAQDASETDKPWERWEAKNSDRSADSWVPLTHHPLWSPPTVYRRIDPYRELKEAAKDPTKSTRKVKLLAWYGFGGLHWRDECCTEELLRMDEEDRWKRVPALDQEIEVENA